LTIEHYHPQDYRKVQRDSARPWGLCPVCGRYTLSLSRHRVVFGGGMVESCRPRQLPEIAAYWARVDEEDRKRRDSGSSDDGPAER
jgi:hypothetical protein